MWRICAFNLYTISRYITDPLHLVGILWNVPMAFWFFLSLFRIFFRSASAISLVFCRWFLWVCGLNGCVRAAICLHYLILVHFQNVIWTWLRIIWILLRLGSQCSAWPLEYIRNNAHTLFLLILFATLCTNAIFFRALENSWTQERVHRIHDCGIQFAKSLWSYFGNGIRAQLHSI